MKLDDNPFEKWGLDPRDSVKKLTAAMKRRSQKLTPDEREQLQRDWRQLMSDTTARARWIALTPPPVSAQRNTWELASELVDKPPKKALGPLQPTLEDALVLPLMEDHSLYAPPPFLPTVMRDNAIGNNPTNNEEE